MNNIKNFQIFICEALLPKSLRNINLIYHSTTFENFINIMEKNVIWSTDSYDFGVATSRNKDYIFGRDWDVKKGMGEIQIILDKNKLKYNYKIKAFDWEEWKLSNDDNHHQSEDKVYKSIKNLDKYVIGFHINKEDVLLYDKEKSKEYEVNIYDYLQKWTFFMKKYEDNNWIIFDKNWNKVEIKYF